MTAVLTPSGEHASLRFWGHEVAVYAPTKADVDHLSFQFRYYLNASETFARPALTVVLSRHGDGSWLDALENPEIKKSIHVGRSGAILELYEEWTVCSSRLTPLPPLQLIPDLSRLVRRHGAAATPPDGAGCWVIAGKSGAGKSSLLLHLLLNGWAYHCDDLSLIDKTRIIPYLRPMNIRPGTLASLSPELRLGVRTHGRAFGANPDVTFLVHPEDLGFAVDPSPTNVQCVVGLEHGQRFAFIPSRAGFTMRWNPAKHMRLALGAIAEATESALSSHTANDLC